MLVGVIALTYSNSLNQSLNVRIETQKSQAFETGTVANNCTANNLGTYCGCEVICYAKSGTQFTYRFQSNNPRECESITLANGLHCNPTPLHLPK